MFKNLSILMVFFFSTVANADFSIKADSGNQIVIDNDTTEEWLKFSSTRGKSINEVVALMDSDYYGWRLPTNAEVTDMLYNLYAVDVGVLEFSQKTARGGALLAGNHRLGETFGNKSTAGAHHRGLYYDEDNVVRLFGAYLNASNYSITYGLDHVGAYTRDKIINGSPKGGVFLIKDKTIPDRVPGDGSDGSDGSDVSDGSDGSDGTSVNDVNSPFQYGSLFLGLLGGLMVRKRKTLSR
jgi:hypothetical protein